MVKFPLDLRKSAESIIKTMMVNISEYKHIKAEPIFEGDDGVYVQPIADLFGVKVRILFFIDEEGYMVGRFDVKEGKLTSLKRF